VILVVEDDPSVLTAVTSTLERYGYRTLQAPNGDVALRLLSSHRGRVDLVLTDTVMPQMSGPELAERLALSHPDLPVLLMTGYADETAMRHRVLGSNANVLLKPFLPAELARRARELLDR
jgi:DNA-binding response OmpR family regulator